MPRSPESYRAPQMIAGMLAAREKTIEQKREREAVDIRRRLLAQEQANPAIALYRAEKAAAEPRRHAQIAIAKAAFERFLSDLQAHQKGGRPRKPVAAVSEGRRRG